MHRDWRFARRPFWLFSHLFAAAMVLTCVALGFWQLDRLDQRQATNALIEARTAESVVLDASPRPQQPDGTDLDYQAVEATGRFLDGDVARIGSRSLNGVAGEHVVALVELADGSALAVNRGFVPLGTAVTVGRGPDAGPGSSADLDPVPEGPVRLTGWLRATVERGRFGAVDDGTGRLLPRFDTERLAERVGRDLPPVWLQLESVEGTSAGPTGLPEALPLPPVDAGPHLGYAVQWFVFAALAAVFYGMLLVRRAGGHDTTATTAPPESPESDSPESESESESVSSTVDGASPDGEGRPAPSEAGAGTPTGV